MSRSKKNRQASFSGKSPPRKPRNCDVRPREYLTADEVRQLMKAARSTGRHGHRDATLILITYRHGLRVSEAIALGWNEVGHDTRAIQPYLGHKNIQHTVRYTQLSSQRFDDFWKDGCADT